MDLRIRPEILAVCRLGPGQPWPVPPDDGTLFSATSTGAEVSLVCREDLAPPGARVEPGWRALTAAGPLDFGLVGVVAGLTEPLARAGISVFTLSTFDTDHLLVQAGSLEDARVALVGGGHTVADWVVDP